MFSILLHLFELFLDSDKTDGDIPGRNSHDLADFLIAEVFQPQEDDGPVKRSQFCNTSPEEFGLPGTLIPVFEQVYIEGKGFGSGSAPPGAVVGNAGVEADFPDPGPQSGLAAEGSGTLPQVDEDFLEEVCHLILVGGEHIADGVNRAAVFPDHLLKFTFCHCLVIYFLSI